jgi:hypothetical protein
MSAADLARMFQRSQRTIDHWLKEGRVSVKNGTRIRTSFYFLIGARDLRNGEGSPIDMI